MDILVALERASMRPNTLFKVVIDVGCALSMGFLIDVTLLCAAPRVFSAERDVGVVPLTLGKPSFL